VLLYVMSIVLGRLVTKGYAVYDYVMSNWKSVIIDYEG
jgi:hypothetical protein